MLGPVIGGPLYEYLGYFNCFACFGGIMFFSMSIAFIITPKELNQAVEEEDTNAE